MVTKAINHNEVVIGGVRYPIIGNIQPTLASVLPGKVVTGDYTIADEQIASSWVMSDLRGGIGIEEMDEGTDLTRSWWSTCDNRFKGHTILPSLATSVAFPTMPTFTITDPGVEDWASADNLTSWTENNDIDRNSTGIFVDGGTYSAKLSGTGAEGTSTIAQNIWTGESMRNVYIVVTVKAYITRSEYVPEDPAWSKVTLKIDDGVGNTTAVTTRETSGWETVTVARRLDAAATKCEISATGEVGSSGSFPNVEYAYAYVDTFTVTAYTTTSSTNLTWANFNGNLYCASGTCLFKLNSGTGAAFTFVRSFPTTITDLVVNETGYLHVFFGDSTNYTTMSTAEAFTDSNTSDATMGIYWDGKVFKVDNDGNIWYSTDPESATPTWTDGDTLGALNLGAGAVKRLLLYRDADGDDAIYAATTKGAYIYDLTNTKWLSTQLSFPNHPSGGLGAVRWRDASYFSAGLDVLKYQAGSTAVITSVGLSRDDAIPSEYNGEIRDMCDGYNEVYALVDSTLSTVGTTTSTLMGFNGTAWRCVWTGGSTEQAVGRLATSSVYAYRLWWGVAGVPYYIDLPRNLLNPLKITTTNYAASAAHVTPWFDAAWLTGHKLALRLKVMTSGCSATETVVVKYRIDRATTGLATTWTTLGTIVTNGETTYTFASSVGLVFKAIQFRFDLARGSTTTVTPDIQYCTFVYMKRSSPAWGWRLTCDCSQSYDGSSPAQLLSSLQTLAETQTLSEFVFRDNRGGLDTKYVTVQSIQGSATPGEYPVGQYTLYLVAP